MFIGWLSVGTETVGVNVLCWLLFFVCFVFWARFPQQGKVRPPWRGAAHGPLHPVLCSSECFVGILSGSLCAVSSGFCLSVSFQGLVYQLHWPLNLWP